MSGQFKVGEVCIGQHFIYDINRNESECVVMTGLVYATAIHVMTGKVETSSRYEVKWPDGMITRVLPKNLRRKQPPSGEQSVMDLFKAPQPERMGEPA